ncbi:acylneuraminate cytidylyltransferase family protein [Marinobacter halodurans]|uniref:Acylneuraminate cytidylyltransferase family protein n=1 Tax=Marinobacter halodurans TaxID=2528979 RepID=A0ABY1ZLR1_9GAMM|nr:acylneuraminate cytidylyltransferase family protein [Marinobacter halodurans]
MKLAIIPARGGSKRLPGKNIKFLCGKPLIQWTIDAAINSRVFDRICVSTDCENIADVARECGAEVPFLRPPELSSDTATTASVLAHFIETFEQRTGCTVNYVCLLQPTSPLRSADDILHTEKMLIANDLDAVVSVCEMEHPIQLCNMLPPDGSLEGFVRPENYRRSQDQEVYYRINGAIYFCKTETAKRLETLYSRSVKSRAYVMDPVSSIDVDTMLDFCLAETVIKNKLKSTKFN